MKTRCLLTFISISVLSIGCLPDGEERCSGNYDWDPEHKSCREKQDTSGASIDVFDGGFGDGGQDPSGIGVPCESEEDCSEYKADFCAGLMFGFERYCTISDCNDTTNSCPAGYFCCISTSILEDVPIRCLKNEEYDMRVSTEVCTE